MKNTEQKSVPSTGIRKAESVAGLDEAYRGEIRFWQSVALSLAIFSAGLITSFVISLVIMLIGN